MKNDKKISFIDKLDSVEEFERTPVPISKVKSFKNFVGMVAGEHIAGTEFVIGPLFVLHGVGLSDILLGLLFGNILATLSWALICAPAAVKTRLTIFYQLEKISGFKLVSIYNVINVLLFCAASAAMISVSSSAIGLLFNFDMPGMLDIYPKSIEGIFINIIVGIVITLVAALGYDQVSKFSNIFAPWMPLIFIAAPMAVLPELGVTSWDSFWEIANSKIWTGIPQPGQTKYTFWHILMFSWLCNTAMHLGLSDMTIYRYAKKASYGFAHSVGMFIGHYLAWLASGILCAVALMNGNSNPSPGYIALYSAGVAGILCVVIAGWTTANPTIYRAGLALQGIFPKAKTWKLTLLIGGMSTVLACSPFLVAKLDQFLGFYALLAGPVGAIVLVDIFLFPKIGLISNYAEKTKSSFNIIVALTWFISVAVCYLIYKLTKADFMFFVALPGWIIGGLTYWLLSLLMQKREIPSEISSEEKYIKKVKVKVNM